VVDPHAARDDEEEQRPERHYTVDLRLNNTSAPFDDIQNPSQDPVHRF
jgi:hypothetical protein